MIHRCHGRDFELIWGLARPFSLTPTHEGGLPLSLRFLERQGGDFCSAAEMTQPSQSHSRGNRRPNGQPTQSGFEHRPLLLAE